MEYWILRSYYKIVKSAGQAEFTKDKTDKKSATFLSSYLFQTFNILPKENNNDAAPHESCECSDIKITLDVGGSGKLAQDICAGRRVQLQKTGE